MNRYTGYWLVYVNASSDEGPPQLTAVPAEATDRTKLLRDAQSVLAAADALHDLHPDARVVFVGEVTRWLVKEKNVTWGELRVDLIAGLAHLDEHAPNVMLDTDPVTAWCIANPADKLVFVVPGGTRSQPVDTASIKHSILNVVDTALIPR